MATTHGELCFVILARPKPNGGNFVTFCDVSEQELRIAVNSATGVIEHVVCYAFAGDPSAKGRLTLVPLPQLGAVAFIDLLWPEGAEPDINQIRAYGAIIPASIVPKLSFQAPVE